MSSLTHENHIQERAFPNLSCNTPGHQILSVCSSVMKQMACSSVVAWPFPPRKEIEYGYEELSFDLTKSHSCECIEGLCTLTMYSMPFDCEFDILRRRKL